MVGRLLTLLAALGMLCTPAASVRAQGSCSNCQLPPGCRGASQGSDAKCTVVLLDVESDVDFGRLIVLGSRIGHVAIDLDSGTKLIFGEINDGGGMPVYGTALVTGQPLRTIAVTMPNTVQLTASNGALATMRDFQTNLPAFPRLDSGGQLRFNFTGTLYTDGAVLSGGRLRGRVPITVDYN
jgi:hypothetical protein